MAMTALLARQSVPAAESVLAADIRRVTVPDFATYARSGDGWTITVPIVSDVQDTQFVQAFKTLVEKAWSSPDARSLSVRLEIKTLTPIELYCGRQPVAGCQPPARGTAIDLRAHIARFPGNVGVLTTGAGSTHFTAGRAIAFSPHDAPARMVIHEFGHLLGFRDAYLRGYRDMGADGYAITELVVDHSDIMGDYRTGAVLPSHVERLLRAKDVPALMRAGLDALYTRRALSDAAARFREVLDRDPAHYGATVQLAKSLDELGTSEARVWWSRALALAREAGDSATIRQAQSRLSR